MHLANIAGGIGSKFGAATVSRAEMEREIARLYSTQKRQGPPAGGPAGGAGVAAGPPTEHRLLKRAFDVLHRGHIEYLEFCRSQGDVVVVGLNSDRSVRALKGPNRPINSEQDRAAVLSGLESVDFITVFDDPSVLDLVRKVRPDVLVKGGDYGKEGVVGWDFVESYGGKVAVAPLVKDKSSTDTIDRIRALQAKPV